MKRIALARMTRAALLASLAPAAAAPALTMSTMIAFTAGLSSLAMAAPEPDAVPRRWELTFEPGPLRVVSVNVNGESRLYYVLTYKVVNKSGQEVLFAPSFDLVTGKGDVIRSGRNVPSSVTSDLIARQGNAMIQDQISILGEMGQGDPNAREGLVVFTAEDHQPGELSLFCAGFSGESTTVKPPAGSTAEPVVLRKTRHIRYAAPGLITSLGSRPLDVTERAWVMR
jgi:hypothetical protein